MILLVAYLHVHYILFLPMVMRMHKPMKLTNSFENWLITCAPIHVTDSIKPLCKEIQLTA